MNKKIKSMDDMPVDMVEAVKRGFIHRGFLPRKYQRNSQFKDDSVEAKAVKLDSQKSEGGEQKKPPAAKDSGAPKQKESSQDDDSSHDEQDPGEMHEKLIDITEKAHDVLFKADTVWPFTLFPDTITLDREKLSVANRSFFRVAKIITVPVTSLISAEADVGPFFGSVKMTSKYFINTEHSIHFLWRKDASEIHRLLQGFVIAQEKGLDVTDIDLRDLRILLRDLGQGLND